MDKVLVIEDDPDLSKVLLEKLQTSGYQAVHEENGQLGLDRALAEQFSVVLLDLNLPGMNGMEICRKLRDKNDHIAILMLTSRSDEIDRILGLEIGADDYITKPFNVRELLARVKAVLRRTVCHCEKHNSKMSFGDLEIDAEKRKVTLQGKLLELTTIEFDVLHFLASHPGRPFTRDELMEHVWGYRATCFEATITTHFSRLRSKLEPETGSPKYIKTVRGVGYRFAEKDEL